MRAAVRVHTGARAPVDVQILLALGVALVWLWLAADGRLHWDEPGYLYAGAYLSVTEVLDADFQPSGLEDFSVSRVGHLLLLQLLTSPLGPGAASLTVIIGCYLLMLAVFLRVSYLILRALTPDAPYADAAVALCALAPGFVYLGFKTLAEIPALLLSALAVLAFIRSLQSHAGPWLAVSALALVGVAVTKNNIALLHISFIAALVVCGGLGHSPRRILIHALVSGIGALAVFFVALSAAGIPLDRYLGLAAVQSLFRDEPLEARLLALALEGGPFFLALPFAFFSPHRAEARFFAIWFGLATLPLFIVQHLEERYFVTNLVALAGLVQLSIGGLAGFVRGWWPARRAVVATAAGLGAVLLVATVALAQPLTGHEVRWGQLSAVLARLEGIYGERSYAILTPKENSVFLLLRVIRPELPVYTVYTPSPPDHRDVAAWEGFQRRHYGSRALHTLDELKALEPMALVYLGIEESFPVTNLRQLAKAVLPRSLQGFIDQRLARMNLLNHLGASWLWRDPRVRLSALFRHGHYVVLEVDTL